MYRLVERDREADGGAEELIVVGVVVDAAIETVDVELYLAEEALGETEFVIVAVRRLNRAGAALDR